MYFISLLCVIYENIMNLKIYTEQQVNYTFKEGTPSVGHISENNPYTSYGIVPGLPEVLHCACKAVIVANIASCHLPVTRVFRAKCSLSLLFSFGVQHSCLQICFHLFSICLVSGYDFFFFFLGCTFWLFRKKIFQTLHGDELQ